MNARLPIDTPLTNSARVAIITGTSRGIGAALVPAYRKLGYSVVAAARSAQDWDDPEVLGVRVDVAQPGAGELVVGAALDRFGRVDTLINNAGIFIAKPFTDYTDDDFDGVTGINVRGVFELTRSALVPMLNQGAGHVVNVSTTLVDHAQHDVPSGLASLTKGGVTALTKSLAIEYATRGIRVNAVALGVIRTPMHAPETLPTLATLHPVGRVGELSDVVDAIAYLEHAPFVTGEVLHVDGGQSAGH